MSESIDLDTVNEESIKELIDRDPRKLTDKDRRQIVNYLRVNREKWNEAETTAKANGTRTTRPKLDLESLDLDVEVDI